MANERSAEDRTRDALEELFNGSWREDLKRNVRNMNFPDGFEELDIEIHRPSGRIFVKEGSNLMNYIKDGKVWVSK